MKENLGDTESPTRTRQTPFWLKPILFKRHIARACVEDSVCCVVIVCFGPFCWAAARDGDPSKSQKDGHR